MTQTPPPVSFEDQPEPANLRFLRILVTVLTATMILGLVTIIGLFVTKFMGATAPTPVLPAEISLPAGEKAQAFTKGRNWLAVVTVDESGQERIHILNIDGTSRQIVEITP